jgi:drug/metabolite transporter (DMT)-like permease
MGWIYILLAVLGVTTVALLAKLSGKKGIAPLDLSVVIFTVSTVIGLVFLLFQPQAVFSIKAVIISAAAGLCGGLAVLVFNIAIKTGHFGFSNSIYRSSFIIPVVYAVLFLDEKLTSTTITAILLILISIFLMAYSTDSFSKGRKAELKWFFLIVAAFLLSGGPRIGQKLTSIYKEDYFVYLFLSYLAGAIPLLAGTGIKRTFNKASLTFGSGAAVGSFVAVFCTLKALESLNSSIVFPASLSGPIILGMILSIFFFKEKVKALGYIGIILGLSGIAVLYFLK